MTQTLIANSVYILLPAIQKEISLELNLGKILEILSIVVFEKVSISRKTLKNTPQNQKF